LSLQNLLLKDDNHHKPKPEADRKSMKNNQMLKNVARVKSPQPQEETMKLKLEKEDLRILAISRVESRRIGNKRMTETMT